jgi:hypothetical protein
MKKQTDKDVKPLTWGTVIFLLLVAWMILWGENAHGATYTLDNDSLPYTVHANGDSIIVNQYLTSGTSGINVNGKTGVTIQLTATLEFGGDGGDNNYGIWTGWGGNNLTIEGDGWIIHDKALVSDSALMNSCVYITGSHTILIDSINCVADGIDGKCVYIKDVNYNIEIAGGIYRSDARGFTSRCITSGAIFYLYTESSHVLEAGEFHYKIHGVTITDAPHVGISLLSSNQTKCLVYFYDNDITISNRNDLYPVSDGSTCHSPGNAYCIGTYGIMGGSEIYNNTMQCGSGDIGCEGILLQDARGTETDTIKVYNNIGVFSYGPYIHQSIGKVSALYWRHVPGEEETWCCYNHIYDNQFTVYVDDDTNTTHIGRDAAAVSTFWFDSCHHNLFERNHVEVISTGVLYYYATALGTNNDDTTNADFAGVEHNLFRNNYWKCGKSPVSLGGSRGWGGNNVILEGDTIDCPFTGNDSTSIRFGKGSYLNHSLGNRMRDIVWLGQANDEDIVWKNQDDDDSDSLGHGVYYERTLRVYVLDSATDAVQDVIVSVVNDYDQTVLVDTTDVDGLTSGIVSYKYVHYNQWGVEYDSAYNDFIITAALSGDTIIDTFTVGALAATDTIAWASGEPPEPPPGGTKVLLKLGSIIQEIGEILCMEDFYLYYSRYFWHHVSQG